MTPVDSGAGLRGSPVEVAWKILTSYTPGLRAHACKLLTFLLQSALARNTLVVSIGRRRVMRHCGLCRKGYDRARKDIAAALPVIVGLRGSPLTYDLRALWAVGLQGSPVPETPGLYGSPVGFPQVGLQGSPVPETPGLQGSPLEANGNRSVGRDQSQIDRSIDRSTTPDPDERREPNTAEIETARGWLRTLRYQDGHEVGASTEACIAALKAAGSMERLQWAMGKLSARVKANRDWRPHGAKTLRPWLRKVIASELRKIDGEEEESLKNGNRQAKEPAPRIEPQQEQLDTAAMISDLANRKVMR